MKTSNEILASEITAFVLGKLKGLNTKSAKKLVKTVDGAAKEVVKKYAKLKKEEIDEKEKEAKKEAKKAKAKAEKAEKEKAKAEAKAVKDAKISLVTSKDEVAVEKKGGKKVKAKKQVEEATPAVETEVASTEEV